VVKLRVQAKDHFNCQSFLNFLQNFADIFKFHGYGQLPRLSSKFHDLRKTVGPSDNGNTTLTCRTLCGYVLGVFSDGSNVSYLCLLVAAADVAVRSAMVA